ncbi:hypothetical protein [Pseudomonas putida]
MRKPSLPSGYAVIDRELLENSRLRILLIEPHAFQLFDTQTLLYELGCHYLTPVMSQDELAHVLRTATGHFDVAICSVGTFDMSDLDLAELVYADRKVRHLILLSDGQVPAPQLLACQVARPAQPLLGIVQKPLKPNTLLALFRRVLGEGLNSAARSMQGHSCAA